MAAMMLRCTAEGWLGAVARHSLCQVPQLEMVVERV